MHMGVSWAFKTPLSLTVPPGFESRETHPKTYVESRERFKSSQWLSALDIATHHSHFEDHGAQRSCSLSIPFTNNSISTCCYCRGIPTLCLGRSQIQPRTQDSGRGTAASHIPRSLAIHRERFFFWLEYGEITKTCDVRMALLYTRHR